MCLAGQKVLTDKTKVDQMSMLVEQIPPPGLLPLPSARGWGAGISVYAPPTARHSTSLKSFLICIPFLAELGH